MFFFLSLSLLSTFSPPYGGFSLWVTVRACVCDGKWDGLVTVDGQVKKNLFFGGFGLLPSFIYLVDGRWVMCI